MLAGPSLISREVSIGTDSFFVMSYLIIPCVSVLWEQRYCVSLETDT